MNDTQNRQKLKEGRFIEIPRIRAHTEITPIIHVAVL